MLTLEHCRYRMTDAIKRCEQIIAETGDENKAIQAMNAMSGLISRYAKLTEITELEKRISKIEESYEVTDRKN